MTVWKVGYYSDLSAIQLNEQRQSWIQAARPGQYQHPKYGVLDFSFERLRRLMDSVKNKVRGIDLDIDYDHKTDVAMGNKAAGWVRDADVRNDGLWLLVEWTEPAAQAIKQKEYRYFSPEFLSEWVDAAGKKFEDVLSGGGITNRPFLKDLLPINLSELDFGQSNENNNEGVEMKLSDLAKAIGLSETATEAEVTAKLAELSKPSTPPTPEPPKESIQLTETIRQLAESNPMVGTFVQLFDQMAAENAANQVKLREQYVSTKLSELDSKDFLLAPAMKTQLSELGLALPTELQEKFWDTVKKLHTNAHTLVQLGEIGGAQVTRSNAPGAVQQLNERVAELVKVGKPASEAYDIVLRDDPALYDRYRKEIYITSNPS